MTAAGHDRDDLDATRRLDGSESSPGLDRGNLTGETLIGRYRVGAMLGHGGMGTVYLAEQLLPVQRTVALKVLGRSRMDLRRRALFEVERQMLARMQHAAIAQIFDAGSTEDGTPFFAMEYIDGVPVTEFARREDLSLRQRLALFLQVCDGVQHAHQKGVIHRDLKPVNILVAQIDGQPRAKIIDFGIAMIAASVEPGSTEPVAGTPSYMSPEQLLGDASQIDIRSDVYSLGIVLYELLTGVRPDAPSATRGGIGHGQSTLLPPSRQLQELPIDGDHTRQALQRPLRDELDHVVLRAAHPDRAQRYPSIQELAADVRRFLDGRPVSAVPQTRRYLMGKFVRRHRVRLLAAAIGLFAVLFGLLVSLYGLRQAQEQRAIAERRQADLEQVVAFQQSMLKDIDVHALGQGIIEEQLQQLARADDDGEAARTLEGLRTRLGASDVARAVIDRFVLARAEVTITRDFRDQPGMGADLRMAIGEVYFAIGLYARSADAFRSAWRAREAESGPANVETLASRIRLGAAQDRLGQVDEGLANLQQVGELLAGHHAKHLALRSENDQIHAWLLAAKGDLPGARSLLEETVARLRAEVAVDDLQLAATLNTLGSIQNRSGDPQAARASLEQALAGREQRLGPDHAQVIVTRLNLSNVHASLGDHERALLLVEDVYERQRRIQGARHPIALMALNNMADSMRELGRNEEALRGFQQVLAARTELLGADHQDTLRARQNVANTMGRMTWDTAALEAHRDAFAARRRVLGESHHETLLSQAALADAYRHLGRWDDARHHAEIVIGQREQSHGPNSLLVLENLLLLVEMNRQLGRRAEASQVAERVLARWRTADGDIGVEIAQEAAWQLVGLSRAGDRWSAVTTSLRDEFLQPLLDVEPDKLSERQRRIRAQLLADAAAQPSH